MKKFARKMLGVTLLEIMLVLAIAAMIIVMSVRYYQSASSSQQANAALQQIQAITAAADSLAQASGSYEVANIGNTTLKPLLPNSGDSNSSDIISPWGTNITVGSPQASTYQVTIPKAPSGVCPLIISKLSTNNHYQSLSPATGAACGDAAVDISYTYTANP